MNDFSFEKIKAEVEKLAERIQAPKNLLPIYGFSLDEGPCVDVNSNGQFSLVYSDRGIVAKSELALDIDHLLFLIFKNVTYYMALRHTYGISNERIDIRRLQLKKQLELLGKLNRKWETIEQKTQEQELKIFPFHDYEGKRQAFFRELMGNGFLYNEALERALKKYP